MILIIDLNAKADSLGWFEFVLPLVAAVEAYGQTAIVRHYCEVTDADLADCTAVLMSGTPLKDTQTLTQPDKFAWLKTFNKPVLGICAGMQTFATVYGLILTRCLEIGMTQIQTLTDNPLFTGTFNAYSLHTLSVESSDEFEVLAESSKCLQAIKHKQKPLYGVLFHPEVRNPQILKNFLQLTK
jgi:GMP synthase (glutamine-hydrolysing)